MKKCPVCESEVKGRVDKIFCSQKCKSIHQYDERQKNEKFFLQVDAQLKTNRKILKRYNKSGYTTVPKLKLHEEGFNPKFFTHYWKNKQGDLYLFCYDYGFLTLKRNPKNKYLIVQWQPYMA